MKAKNNIHDSRGIITTLEDFVRRNVTATSYEVSSLKNDGTVVFRFRSVTGRSASDMIDTMYDVFAMYGYKLECLSDRHVAVKIEQFRAMAKDNGAIK